MKTKLLVSTLLATALGAGLRAADAVVTPTTPAPTIVTAPAAAPAPTQVVYSPRLPTPAELTIAAAAQGVTVERIEQGANQVTATYRQANGQANTVVYQVLPPAGVPAQAAAMAAPPVTAAAPAVVYAPAPQVVYVEDYYRPYYSPYYYPPVSLHLGFGYGYRHFGGGYHHRWR